MLRFSNKNQLKDMSFDDFDDFDEWDDDVDPEELERVHKARHERLNNLPIMIKAMEIFHLTRAIVATIDEEKDELEIRNRLMENASMLGPKISSAEAGELYTLRMENAVIIKMHARELHAETAVLEMEELAAPEYVEVLRAEIEEFRKLFIDWVSSFDKSNDIADEWGNLFA
jgi:hypothetical protein